MLQPRTIHRTRARKSEAKRLRHRLVVQGLVVTRRAMSPPLLQHIAAQATSSTPRRVAGAAGSRRGATESGAPVMSETQAGTILTAMPRPTAPSKLLPRLDRSLVSG